MKITLQNRYSGDGQLSGIMTMPFDQRANVSYQSDRIA